MGSKSEVRDEFRIWYFAVSSCFPNEKREQKNNNISC